MKIKVIRGDTAVTVSPWPSTLSQELTCKRRKTELAKGGRLKFIYEDIPMYFLDKATDTGLVYPGLYSRTIRHLRENKYEYELIDRSTPLPRPLLDKVTGELREGQDVILATICSTRRGVIVSPPGSGKTYIIEQLCNIYPDQNILVVTGKSAVLKDIKRRVNEACPNRKLCIVKAGSPPKTGCDVMVCSSKSLHKIDASWPDLLLFDEVHGAAAPGISLTLQAFAACRMLGFTASPKGRSDGAELLIEALFGPQICTIDYKDAQKAEVVAPIDVYMVKVRAAEIEKTFPVARERHNIWRNTTRNRIIAEQAAKYEDESVLILVNTVEHALFLKRHLPDYKVVHAGIDKESAEYFKRIGVLGDVDVKVDMEGLKTGFRQGDIKHVIATSVWREGVDFPDLKVLIRADASAGQIPAIQIGGRLSRIAEGKDRGIIIDFIDDFGKSFYGRSEKRMKYYRKQGWLVREF